MEARRFNKNGFINSLIMYFSIYFFSFAIQSSHVTALTLVATLLVYCYNQKMHLLYLSFMFYWVLQVYQFSLVVQLVLVNYQGLQGGFIFSWPIAYTLLSVFKGSKKSFFSYAWRLLYYNSCSIPIWCGRLYDSYKNRTLGSVASSNVPIHSRGHCKMSRCFLVSN